MQENAITILLFIIALLNGAYLIGQKNQRDDMRTLATKLEHWIEEFIRLKAQHDSTFPDCRYPVQDRENQGNHF
jgi:hypothetical protein